MNIRSLRSRIRLHRRNLSKVITSKFRNTNAPGIWHAPKMRCRGLWTPSLNGFACLLQTFTSRCNYHKCLKKCHLYRYDRGARWIVLNVELLIRCCPLQAEWPLEEQSVSHIISIANPVSLITITKSIRTTINQVIQVEGPAYRHNIETVDKYLHV